MRVQKYGAIQLEHRSAEALSIVVPKEAPMENLSDRLEVSMERESSSSYDLTILISVALAAVALIVAVCALAAEPTINPSEFVVYP